MKWRVTPLSDKPLSVCCHSCERISKGIPCGNPELNAPLSVSGCGVRSNEEVLHLTLTEFKSSSNVFKTYLDISKKWFTDSNPARLAIKQRFLELIFLRFVANETLRLQLSSDIEIKTEEFQNSLGFNLGIVNLGVTSSNAKDLPTNLNVVFNGDVTMHKFSTLMNTLYHMVECNSDLQKMKKFFLVRMLRSRVQSMFYYTAHNPQFLVGRRNIAYAYLTKCEKFINEQYCEMNIDNTRVQIHELVGKPGCGKSRSVDAMYAMLKVFFPVLDRDDLIYVRTNDYWWNGYNGQPIIVYDDMMHNRRLKFDLNFELISIGSGTLRKPPMAFEKDMVFGSSFCYASNNIPIITKVSRPETAMALKRRIISQVVKPMEGFAEFNGDYWKFSLTGSIYNVMNIPAFSLFAETLDLIKENQDEELKFNGKKLEFEFDEESDLDDTTPPQTSSVPESHSGAITCVTGVSVELGVQSVSAAAHQVFNLNGKLALVNTEDAAGSMLSGYLCNPLQRFWQH